MMSLINGECCQENTEECSFGDVRKINPQKTMRIVH